MKIVIDKMIEKEMKTGLWMLDRARKYVYLYIRKRKTPFKLRLTEEVDKKINTQDWKFFDELVAKNFTASGNVKREEVDPLLGVKIRKTEVKLKKEKSNLEIYGNKIKKIYYDGKWIYIEFFKTLPEGLKDEFRKMYLIMKNPKTVKIYVGNEELKKEKNYIFKKRFGIDLKKYEIMKKEDDKINIKQIMEQLKKEFSYEKKFKHSYYKKTPSLWVKYGQARLYIPSSAYEIAGYIDLQTGEVFPNRPGNDNLLRGLLEHNLVKKLINYYRGDLKKNEIDKNSSLEIDLPKLKNF